MASIDNYSNNSLPAEGVYTARLAHYIELGLMETKFGASYQARAALELCEPTRKAGKPILVFKVIFNVSLRSQKFRDFVKAVTNRAELSGMDLQELIGCPCEAAITHKETEGGLFADVEVTRYKGTAKLPPLVSEPIFFSLHHSDFDADVLEALPKNFMPTASRT
jgi:hypothetical protein